MLQSKKTSPPVNVEHAQSFPMVNNAKVEKQLPNKC